MKTKDQMQAIARRLSEIEERDGRLTAAAVVREAKNPKSPLHDSFNWDQKTAAMRWWISQARVLISRVRVIHTTTTTTLSAPAYIRDPTAGPHEPGYRSVARLRTEIDLAREALVAECARLEGLIRRLRTLASALQLGAEVDNLLAGVISLRGVATGADVENRVH